MMHGQAGCELEDMEWDPVTGLATFAYSDPERVELTQVVRAQPTRPGHVGWNEQRFESRRILTID